MSYIAFDLDALNVVPDVAAACGLPAGDVAHGLLKLWAWCFREKTDLVSSTHLAGFFGGKPAGGALEAFGFLHQEDQKWRVRGASRYLRITEARRKGGLAAAKNLIPGGPARAQRQPRVQPSSSPASAETQPRLDLGSTPTTDDRTPTTESLKAAPPKKPAAPRETDALVGDFLEIIGKPYVWAKEKDGVAFASLRRVTSLEEIRGRWRQGLKSNDKWLGVRTVAELASKWNNLAAPPDGEKPAFDPNQGIIRSGIRHDPVAMNREDPFPWTR